VCSHLSTKKVFGIYNKKIDCNFYEIRKQVPIKLIFRINISYTNLLHILSVSSHRPSELHTPTPQIILDSINMPCTLPSTSIFVSGFLTKQPSIAISLVLCFYLSRTPHVILDSLNISCAFSSISTFESVGSYRTAVNRY